MKHIFLIGMPCSGKTTLGRAVALRTAMDFVDLDEAITARAGLSVAEIFRKFGQEGFRDLEAEALRAVASLERPTLIACGGGTPCFKDNIRTMKEHGTVVWLDATAERLADRLCLYGDSRPLVAGKSREEIVEYVEATLKERRKWYEKADHHFEASRLDTPDELEAAAERFRKEYL